MQGLYHQPHPLTSEPLNLRKLRKPQPQIAEPIITINLQAPSPRGPTYSLHCVPSSFFWSNQIYIKDPKKIAPKKELPWRLWVNPKPDRFPPQAFTTALRSSNP